MSIAPAPAIGTSCEVSSPLPGRAALRRRLRTWVLLALVGAVVVSCAPVGVIRSDFALIAGQRIELSAARYSRPSARSGQTPRARSGQLLVRYLRAGGVYFEWQGQALMTAPFASNYPLLTIPKPTRYHGVPTHLPPRSGQLGTGDPQRTGRSSPQNVRSMGRTALDSATGGGEPISMNECPAAQRQSCVEFEQNASSVQVPPQVCDPQKPQQMAEPHSLVDWQGSGSQTLPGPSEMVTHSVPSGQSSGSLSQGISQLQKSRPPQPAIPQYSTGVSPAGQAPSSSQSS